jgi:DNA-binding MarR family transcriptional regulator
MESDSQLIFDSIRRIVQSLRQASKSTEKHLGISAAQLFVLRKIANFSHAPSINDLAQATMTHQSSVSVVVSKLVRKKMLERIKSKQDLRTTELRLTKAGLKLLKASPLPLQQQIENALKKMPVKTRHGLAKGLVTLIRGANLQDQEAALFFEDRGNRKK